MFRLEIRTVALLWEGSTARTKETELTEDVQAATVRQKIVGGFIVREMFIIR